MRLRLFVAAPLAVLGAACGQAPASLQFVDFTPANPQLGQTVTLRFVAQDNYGNPQAGVPVNFKLQSASQGLTINPTSGITNKGDGTVLTQLTATSRVSSATVVASSGGASATSPPITFAGTTANGRHITFQCGERSGTASGGIHAIGAFDPSRTLLAGVHISCSVHVADRNGDGVPGASVSFLTEAGAIQPSGTTVADSVGNASVIHVASQPLPQDVAPGKFELHPTNDLTHIGQWLAPMWMAPYEWHANPVRDWNLPPDQNEPQRTDPITGLTNNPRDNLVTMIAVTSGEEGFTDTNGNGVWDPGETFDDLTEPFVDSNDNGTWDPGELFIDTNGNGRWDGKNGKWDSNTLIWAQERVLWTGFPATEDLVDPVSPTLAVFPAAPDIPHTGSQTLQFFFSDPWYNSIAQDGNGDGCTIGAANNAYSEIPSADGGVVPVLQPTVYATMTAETGVPFLYPAAGLHEVKVFDYHTPGTQFVVYPQPVNFILPITCQWTAAQISGYTTTYPFELGGLVH